MKNLTSAEPILDDQDSRRWFALVTTPQHDKSAHGAMRGVEGALVRTSSEWRCVLMVQLIHAHIAVEVNASTLEPIIH